MNDHLTSAVRRISRPAAEPTQKQADDRAAMLAHIAACQAAVTATQRDYSTEPGERFLLDTEHPDIAGFIFTVAEDKTTYVVGAGILRDVARELGTDLLGWVCGGMCSTMEDVYYDTANGSKLYAYAVDSICTIGIDSNTAGAVPVEFEMNTDVTIDLAQRLICFAGVNVAAVMEV